MCRRYWEHVKFNFKLLRIKIKACPVLGLTEFDGEPSCAEVGPI
jgi:hypothetical protein